MLKLHLLKPLLVSGGPIFWSPLMLLPTLDFPTDKARHILEGVAERVCIKSRGQAKQTISISHGKTRTQRPSTQPSQKGEKQRETETETGGGGLAGRGGFHFISFQNYRINKPLKLREGRLLPKAKD